MKDDGTPVVIQPVLLCDICSAILAYTASDHPGTECRFFIHWAGQNICGECCGLFGWAPYPRMLDAIENGVPGDVLAVN
jgi:hypothetical protein